MESIILAKVKQLLLVSAAAVLCCLFLFLPKAFAWSYDFCFELIDTDENAIPIEGWDDPYSDDVRFYYTGRPVEPRVVSYSGYSIKSVTYKNNVNPGVASAVVTYWYSSGKYDDYGNYINTSTLSEVVLPFRIQQATIEKDDFYFSSYTSTFAYTGSPVKPKVASEELESGVDYTVKYINNTKVGTAKAIITGKGFYHGTVTLNYKIKRLTSVVLSNAYNGTKKVSGKIFNIVKGDVVKLKIGKKTYTKKIQKSAKSLKFSFKVPKQSYGKKYTVTVYDKKKKISSKKGTVWYTNKLKIGQTKKQVELNPNWGKPSHVNKSRYTDTWVYESYDSDDNWVGSSYLYFRNGRLSSWIL